MAHRDAAAPQLLGDEVRGEELAQVAEVDRARRAGPGGDGHEVALAGVPDGVVRRARHPVDGFAVLLPHLVPWRKANGLAAASRTRWNGRTATTR